jgi:hypothetical protein
MLAVNCANAVVVASETRIATTTILRRLNSVPVLLGEIIETAMGFLSYRGRVRISRLSTADQDNSPVLNRHNSEPVVE